MLVEDNADSQVIYRTILEHAGYSVVECTDGIDVMRCALEEQPDLILMDIMLPGLNGWEATRMLKADKRTRTIPVIALTAHALAKHRQQAEEIGFDGYLTKPVEPRQVLAIVDAKLGNASTVPSPEG